MLQYVMRGMSFKYTSFTPYSNNKVSFLIIFPLRPITRVDTRKQEEYLLNILNGCAEKPRARPLFRIVSSGYLDNTGLWLKRFNYFSLPSFLIFLLSFSSPSFTHSSTQVLMNLESKTLDILWISWVRCHFTMEMK